MMSPEELLRIRYKVIVDYFYNPYKIGDIITVEYEDRSVHLTTTSYRNEFGETVDQANYFNPARLKDFPHLFQPLQWWEDRKPEEINGLFVKCKTGWICKIKQHHPVDEGEPHIPFFTTDDDELGWYYSIMQPVITNEQEYLEYIKQNK